MNKNAIIDIILKHKPYQRYCNKLSNYSYIASDLYQEFFIIMFEKTEDDLIRIYNSGYLEPYCLTVILNISRDINRIKKNNDSNPLLSICNNYEKIGDYIDDEQYNHSIDQNFDNVMSFIDSDKNIKTTDVLILFESLDSYVKDIAKNSKLPYITVRTKRKRLINRIKENVKIETI